MSLLSKMADRMILCPSVEPIDPGENRRELIFSTDNVEIEAWVSQHGEFEATPAEKRLIVLKIPGTGGRAERASVHPAELLVDGPQSSPFAAAEVWTLNHRGYGGSTGPASLKHFISTINSFWSFVSERFPTAKKLVTGNSLGCISTFYLASRFPVDAILIRNPPPLARLISDRPKYNWWNFGMAKVIANQVPPELSSLTNASSSACPALMVTSEKDSIVPPKYQQEVKNAYLGDIKQFIIEGADHDDRIPVHQETEYLEAIAWLLQKLSA